MRMIWKGTDTVSIQTDQKSNQYLQELNENTFGKYDDVVTVGEMSSTTLENSIRYSNPESNELSMIFSFHHLKVDYPSGINGRSSLSASMI